MADAPAPRDDDEWEYEYSTTETETHLVTLDLSLPEFVRRDDDVVVHNTRGGFRSWLNPINLDAGDGTPAAAQNLGQGQAAKKGNGADGTGDVQLLDLHGEPIIAYRGMLFRGAWADTIGTEMLFADSTAFKMGKARSELVGAASARITCSPVELRDYKATERAAAMKRARKRLGFVIPVANGATAQRQKQGAFLESLMAVKHRRSEGDVVTVLAVDTKENKVHDDADEVKRQQRPSVAKRSLARNHDGQQDQQQQDEEADEDHQVTQQGQEQDDDELEDEGSPQVHKKAKMEASQAISQARPSKGKGRAQ
ncbi:hypothetical protein F503_04044 [Ophiostoma piceae UAMH 11346]|uniref:Transcription factor TFIIIC triple barrel domain-containing protein n=1 Tax=Ophiostoma piceae (strain UAMH 11346) TaxID=1262450 RepID=S3CQ32_OPHP1|nr:hypothetical protein F503_04044 [Ophiostoma piceae UAMH 11346]